MSDDLFNKVYNPDVLSCLANLSNDEVFTSPDVVNQMLDMLPQELFENPDTTFLDPACKTGVFLREIAKRLLKGLENQIPDLQDRVDHIFHKQLYGIAITELTSLLSRRGVYCSKYANGEFSITHFENADGNIRSQNCNHTFQNGRCIYCGTSEITFGDSKRSELETHAYEFIHGMNVEEVFKMKFDVIISNPPYQMDDGGNGSSATPIYQYFVERAKALKPKYISMIIPSRWFAGGKGLDQFRTNMLNDSHISNLVDYVNAKDCFSPLSVGGGVCYFLWDSNYNGPCAFKSIRGQKQTTSIRKLNEFPVFVRYNSAVEIIKKVQSLGEKSISDFVLPRNPFGLPSKFRGEKSVSRTYPVLTSAGINYATKDEIVSGIDILNEYKVVISKATSEHAGEPSSDGTFTVVSTLRLLQPNEICTDSYIVLYHSTNQDYANNYLQFVKTKFYRFLLLQAVTSINLSKEKFIFIPTQDFSKPLTDDFLFSKYKLTQEEIDFISSLIKEKKQ